MPDPRDSTALTHPWALPNHNQAPDYAKEVTDRMAREYAEVIATVDTLEAEANAFPETTNNDEEALARGAVIKRIRDLDARLENIRVSEGEPYLRSTNGINALFFGLRDRLGKRNKSDRKAADGAADRLQQSINKFQEWKIAEETARRAREAAAAKAEADRLAREAAEQQRLAEEARLQAERARAPAQIQAKTDVAADRIEQAAVTTAAAESARDRAEDARIATLARPADMARVRGDDGAGAGVTLTVAKENYALVTDRTLLDKAALWPFFTDAEIEKALRAWAKTTGHRQTMAGAEVGSRNKGVTR